jgi:hypothetical protein
MNHAADAERARLLRLYPDIFHDGARCAFHRRHPGRRDPGGYPFGFSSWEIEARNAWFAGYNYGRTERERGARDLSIG